MLYEFRRWLKASINNASVVVKYYLDLCKARIQMGQCPCGYVPNTLRASPSQSPSVQDLPEVRFAARHFCMRPPPSTAVVSLYKLRLRSLYSDVHRQQEVASTVQKNLFRPFAPNIIRRPTASPSAFPTRLPTYFICNCDVTPATGTSFCRYLRLLLTLLVRIIFTRGWLANGTDVTGW